jgi:DNA-binding SARP family transcriptional activator
MVFGPPRVYFWQVSGDRRSPHVDITGVFQPRLRELLVLLALHPDGATRTTLTDALWPDKPPARVTNALHTALSRLRRTIMSTTRGALSDVVIVGEGVYRLDPALVEVDYWPFAAAVSPSRRAAGTEFERVGACRAVVDAYGGQLAEGLMADWVEPIREAARRDALDAVAALARTMVDTDPEQTLDLLEIARGVDPHNELIYRDIMRLQERLGRLYAIPRTLTLLETRLAEIGERPTRQVVDLATRLQQRHEA